MQTIHDISVEELHFDPLNPRIPDEIDASDDQAVLDWMLEDASLVELMGSIAANGYFPAEPLLVMAITENSGYYVLEGNRRLAAVRLLLDPARAPRRKIAVASAASEVGSRDSLRNLPCAVFAHRSEVLDYLGFRHITGIKEWEPAAKAKYLNQLYVEHGPTAGDDVYRRIARIIGSRSDYVMRLLGALRLYEVIASDGELRERGVLAEDLSFSLLTLALNYSTINAYLNLDALNQEAFQNLDTAALRNLAVWMYAEDPETGRTQLGESRSMKLLAAALQRPAGLDSLLRGETVEDAVQASLDVGEVVVRSVKQAATRLLRAQSFVHRVPTSEAIALALEELERIQDLVDQMIDALRRRQRRSDRTDV